MAATSGRVVIDHKLAQKNTVYYEYTLYRALVYLLRKDTVYDKDLAQNLIAIRTHLLTPRPGLIFRRWLHTWTHDLYWIWANHVAGREQKSLAVEVNIRASKPELDC
jgi:hypothetical protein